MSDVQKTEPLSSLAIVDKLNELRAFVECAELAVSGLGLDRNQKNAMSWVLLHATEGLDELAEKIHPRANAKTGEEDGAEENAND